MCKENNLLPVLSRPNYLSNKVVIVDGIVGGGKGMMSAIVGALPRVEMWVNRPKVEQVCAMHHLGHITTDGAVVLLKNWMDEEILNLSIMRDINCRPSDMSSIFRDARPIRYLKRLFSEVGDASVQRVINEKSIVNFMTHSNTAYALPIFEAFSDRLVYVRLTRCPMTEYMLNHLARWSKRWGNDVRSGMLLHKTINYDKDVPFFMLNNEEEYMSAQPVERSILMLSAWQRGGNAIVDSIEDKTAATIIEVPFEKFVFDPLPYVLSIAEALETNIDDVTKKMMKKQKVPRASLIDAPKNKAYIKLGWKAPKEHLTVLDEFAATRKLYIDKVSTTYKKLLDDITDEYIDRYDIE